MKTNRIALLLTLAASPLLAQNAPPAKELPALDSGAYADNACVNCHKDLPGRLSEVVQEWSQSIHIRNNVACHSCHGGDAGVRRDQFDSEEAFKRASHLQRDTRFFSLPRSDDVFISAVRGRNVSYFCGKCHANIKEKHLGSPHGELGNPTCLYCHGQGSHAIAPSSVDIIDLRARIDGGRCATCHRAATMETVGRIKSALIDAQDHLGDATGKYAWLKEHGYTNLAMEEMIQDSQVTLSHLRQTFHSFNMREISNYTATIKENVELTNQAYEMINSLEQARSQQALVGTGAVIFLLTFAGLLLYYYKTYLCHSDRHEG